MPNLTSKEDIIAKLIELPDSFKGFLFVKRSSGIKPHQFHEAAKSSGIKAKVPIIYVNELDEVDYEEFKKGSPWIGQHTK